MAVANNPFTATTQQNAQRVFLAETAINYQNEADVWSMYQTWEDTPLNAKGVQVPLETSPNASLSVPNIDNGATPSVGARSLDNMTINYAPLMQGRGETYGAILNNNKETAEDEIMRNAESDLKQQIKFLNDYVSRGDGTAGLGIVSAYTNPSTTVTLNGSSDSIGPSQLVKNQYVTFWDSTGATQRVGTVGAGAIQISSKTASTIVLASNAPSDVVAGDVVAPEIGTTDATTALVGLPKIISASGTYFGKSRSSVTQLQAYELTSAGTLTAGQLFTAYASMKQRGGYFSEKLEDQLQILVNITQYANYYNLSLSSGAVVGSPNYLVHQGDSRPQMDLGMAKFDFTWFGAPIKVCNSLRGDEIYFTNPKYLKKAVLKNIGELPDVMPHSEYLPLYNSSGYPLLSRATYRDFIGQAFSPTPHKLGKISGITVGTLPTQKALMV
jgi:hypothetical protein